MAEPGEQGNTPHYSGSSVNLTLTKVGGQIMSRFGDFSLYKTKILGYPVYWQPKQPNQVGSLEFWGSVYSSSKDDLDTCIENTFVPPIRSTLPEITLIWNGKFEEITVLMEKHVSLTQT